ncbi:Glycosyl transferase, family 14 [Artemisia annua]|uniref:Glycosyl transferase, family 14 n=1 Tax=Artemisia annua TaxID=35608 RepID=A0A2U1PET4_ARTAN|nr:Glycosyl transferase, family 14 [Artemisia annua]
MIKTKHLKSLSKVPETPKSPDELLEKLNANDVNVGLRYDCVRNRINDETYDVARIQESKLFETHPLLSKIDKSMVARSRYFWDRQVNNSIQIYWGEATMIQAEIILLRHALMDPSNERFAFVSDSCIPLYNFSYTYDYIMSTSTSFVDRL